MTAYDLVVIGTGSSGNTVATTCARAGWRVAIVDELPYGGTCALRGCDPKKVLVGAAELIDWCERMRGSGFSGAARIDWPELMRFKRTFTDPVPQQREESYRELGIDMHRGPARFLDPTTLSVADRRLEARRIVLAAGARPASLGIAGEEHLITSTGFLDLERLPPRVAFIGGGYIAFEFAHLAARAGAAPVILQRGPRVLTGFDSGLVDELVDVSRDVGIDVRVGCAVRGVDKRASGFVVSGSAGAAQFAVECDLVVHAAGRLADLDDLDLAAGNVQRTDKGVAVNEFLQSRSNSVVYAVGDCADGGGLPLTPTASAEGEVAARNLLEGNHHSVDFAGLVSIVYTVPALGSTGLTQAAAQERGLPCTVRAADSTQWYSSRRIRARRSAFRVIVEDSSGRILGAHVLGPHAEELLNIFSLAIRARIPAAVLERALFGYPTASSDIADMLQSSK
ncbi:MAG TPA: NAD(P)/FAD-dependent oxidoreductase [Candidatus Cybelea sp.]